MHWTAGQPGGFDNEQELRLVDQTPGEVIFASTADTDLAAVASIWTPMFGRRLRLAQAGAFRQPVAADDYMERVAMQARLVILRLLGGHSYFRHLLQAIADLKEEPERPAFLILSGTDSEDPELTRLSDFSASFNHAYFQYFKEGGASNIRHAGVVIWDWLQGNEVSFPEAEVMPDFGTYRVSAEADRKSRVWVCFYRAWYQADDLRVVDALHEALEAKGLAVRSCYAYSLRRRDVQTELLKLADEESPQVILTLQSFSICLNDPHRLSFLEELGCPVLQVPVAASSRERWLSSKAGLPPAEVAINVALPEIDGRLLGTVVGFKEEDQSVPEVECTIRCLEPDPRQVEFVAALTVNWIGLQQKPNAEKRIAVILSNYPSRDGRIGNGVGLDTPASAVHLLSELHRGGFHVDPVPSDSEALMQSLMAGKTNDPEQSYGRKGGQQLDGDAVASLLENLPDALRNDLAKNWDLTLPEAIDIPGLRLGNVFVGIQPPRGFGEQTQAVYHSPSLPPPPHYLAFYQWLREQFQADAVVHLGKHGNLEWLPGRSVALGPEDYPFACLPPIPHFYPFIVNNPGEGAQSKRRTWAVILDHLTPPLQRAGLYDELDRMERLLDEHAHAVTLYPQRAAEIEKEIYALLEQVPWAQEIPKADSTLEAIGQFLCEIKESQIRSGLHVLGQAPEGEKQVDFLLSLLRAPSGDRPGLLEALAGEAVDFDAMGIQERDNLEDRARSWLKAICHGDATPESGRELARLERIVRQDLLVKLNQTPQEIGHLIGGLNGRFVPPGPAGAPTRGRLDVLPTGRNFFSVDPRVIPTPTAWEAGRRMGDTLLERHHQEHGEYPQKVAMVLWGTSNMRTGGDDIAQALWLWGCEPVWEQASGRVTDFRILPVSHLGRPRVDLLLRVSGLFRDAFADTLRLLATIPKRLAELEESEHENPVRASWLEETAAHRDNGVDDGEAARRASRRVFSSEPGSYGAGLLPLMDGGNWNTAGDLASVFIEWGNHAYDSDGSATEEAATLKKRLSEIQAIHQNQDNREHDILDSDDYFQFQGGLHAAVEHFSGRAPATYHGDSSRPETPRVRSLKEELVRVVRGRVLNPKWIHAMREHGYKGAFEMAATVDYLFGYGATTRQVPDQHYEEVAQRLLLDAEQKRFFQRYNPIAYKEATQRLIEAYERGIWTSPTNETLNALEQNLLELEGDLE